MGTLDVCMQLKGDQNRFVRGSNEPRILLTLVIYWLAEIFFMNQLMFNAKENKKNIIKTKWE